MERRAKLRGILKYLIKFYKSSIFLDDVVARILSKAEVKENIMANNISDIDGN